MTARIIEEDQGVGRAADAEAALSPSATAPVVAALPGNDQPRWTSGPWSIHPYSTPELIPVASGRFRFASLGIGSGDKLLGEVRARDGGGGGYPEPDLAEMHANAHLISAAPDLFTALEDFDNWFCGFDPDKQSSRMEGRKVIIRARAALAKARGQ